MFQFPGLPPSCLCVQHAVTWVLHAGFPHSDIRGSMPADGSPRLFAANHVLLRPIVPRHPPCALRSFLVHARSASLALVQLLRSPGRLRRPPCRCAAAVDALASSTCLRASVGLRPVVGSLQRLELRGLEPLTLCLQSRCSSTELQPRTSPTPPAASLVAAVRSRVSYAVCTSVVPICLLHSRPGASRSLPRPTSPPQERAEAVCAPFRP